MLPLVHTAANNLTLKV